jgi:uncharacterized membrane protein HdeD (DUF308 family)
VQRKTLENISKGVIFFGVLLIIYGYFTYRNLVLFIGVGVILFGVFFIMGVQSIFMFIEDKKLDIDQLRKQGYTIVKCSNCERENVLEDQYCIYCNEKLEDNNESQL